MKVSSSLRLSLGLRLGEARADNCLCLLATRINSRVIRYISEVKGSSSEGATGRGASARPSWEGEPSSPSFASNRLTDADNALMPRFRALSFIPGGLESSEHHTVAHPCRREGQSSRSSSLRCSRTEVADLVAFSFSLSASIRRAQTRPSGLLLARCGGRRRCGRDTRWETVYSSCQIRDNT